MNTLSSLFDRLHNKFITETFLNSLTFLRYYYNFVRTLRHQTLGLGQASVLIIFVFKVILISQINTSTRVSITLWKHRKCFLNLKCLWTTKLQLNKLQRVLKASASFVHEFCHVRPSYVFALASNKISQ